MKQATMILFAATLLGGCMTSQMKSTPFYSGGDTVYTGKAEDRVNLWPLAYYREPMLSVLWPMLSLTDDHFAFRPLYSQFRQGGKGSPYDEYNFLWPICQFDTRHHDNRFFPVFWGKNYFNVFPLFWSSHGTQCLLPCYYHSPRTTWIGPAGWCKDGSSWCFPLFYRDQRQLVTPLFGYDKREHSSWALPLFYRDETGFLSLPYMAFHEDNKDFWAVPPLLSWGESDAEARYAAFLLGMFGCSREADGSTSHWTMPFYYRSPNRFCSSVWCQWHDEKAKEDGWAVPLALSWGSHTGTAWHQRYLLGLAGVDREKNGRFADWLAPLYYRTDHSFYSLPFCKDRAGYLIPPLLTAVRGKNVASPLFGWDESCSWLMPLYYKDPDTFVSALYCRDEVSYGSTTNVTHTIPALLSQARIHGRKEGTTRELRFLLNVAGVDTKADGGVDKSWIFPLYYNDEDTFLSLPFAHVKDEFTFLTPFLGVIHGYHDKGGWLWPLFGWQSDRRMDEAEAMMNAETLDEKITMKRKEYKYAGGTNVVFTLEGEKDARETSWRLSGLSTSERIIEWDTSHGGKTVWARDWSCFGNILAYQSQFNRKVEFDYATKKKLSDEEDGDSGIFCNFLWHSKHEKKSDGHEYSLKSVLWRFWHYEKLNGDVSVDSFPFFTYDSKTNGYSKTSLCWRLFRNEYDPQKGRRAVDFLFIPVWR